MDFLVPSVLFGIALLAVILLVVLISIEARTKRQNTEKPKTATTESHPETPAKIETPETLAVTEASETLEKIEVPETPPVVIEASETPAKIEVPETPPVAIGNQWSSLSHDQRQDLSLELRNVHQQVYQIEQKLDLLTTRIEYIEQMYNGHTQIREEQETLELPQTPEGPVEDYPIQSP